METFKTILELLYYLSGPALAIAAFLGLKELEISKENSKTNAKRESLKLSANQCKFYLEHIISAINDLDKKLDKYNIDFNDRVDVKIEEDQISISPKENKPNIAEGISNISEELAYTLNLLESFSLYFTSGVADERAAFSSVGSTFCYTIKDYLPIIVYLNDGKNYENILKLFTVWNRRLETKELLKDKEKLDNKLASRETVHINPIGT